MRTELQKIVIAKEQTKTQLNNLSIQYNTIIYKGLVSNQSFNEVHKELLNATINQKRHNEATDNKLLKTALWQFINLNRKKPRNIDKYADKHYKAYYSGFNPMLALSMFIFDNLKQEPFDRSINEIARERESQSKDKVIEETLNKNRENAKIFYLASSHNDCALDHKDYQGKIYVDKYWKRYVKTRREEVETYIQTHNIQTFQWVIGKPVWFVTRPNCRHYFQALTIDEVIGSNTQELIKKYDMHRAIGRRAYVQTIAHSTNRVWYQDVRNAELLLIKYKERLKLHKSLYSTFPNPLIKNAIEKDKLLIAKWSRYLQNKK